MSKELTLFDNPNEAFNQSFHNTVGFEGNKLKEAEINCVGQELDILNYFKRQSRVIKTKHSPSDIHHAIWGDGIVPLTSVRRAMSNLTKKGILMKTARQKDGVYGKPEYLWQLNN